MYACCILTSMLKFNQTEFGDYPVSNNQNYFLVQGMYFSDTMLKRKHLSESSFAVPIVEKPAVLNSEKPFAMLHNY